MGGSHTRVWLSKSFQKITIADDKEQIRVHFTGKGAATKFCDRWFAKNPITVAFLRRCLEVIKTNHSDNGRYKGTKRNTKAATAIQSLKVAVAKLEGVFLNQNNPLNPDGPQPFAIKIQSRMNKYGGSKKLKPSRWLIDPASDSIS